MSIAQWKSAPTNAMWTDPSNWSSDAVPTTTATFDGSAETALEFAPESTSDIGSVEFADTAASFTFSIRNRDPNPALIISGPGVINHSLSPQSFIVASLGTYHDPQLKFTGSASAGGETVSYYAGPSDLETSYGGGTIGFYDSANAGAAQFLLRTGTCRPPSGSTLGGQVIFWNTTSAGTAHFSVWGTLGKDGDTFASCVFHDTASAGHATFANHCGTVPTGDGGNTQFYSHSTAAQGVFLNFGGTVYDPKIGQSNGGDTAFDGSATGGNGVFNNFPGQVAGANGGITSFNNNPNFPAMPDGGGIAGNGTYLNFGADDASPGTGGHTLLSARHGYSTADHATMINFGSTQSDPSTAGHTTFSVGNPYSNEHDDGPSKYFPTAAHATIWNHPGVSGGYTEFKLFGSETPPEGPKAGSAVIHCLGADKAGESGGYVAFSGNAQAETATLIAYGGKAAGQGGVIRFADAASGGTARVSLAGNGTLDLTGLTTALGIGALDLNGGEIRMTLDPGQPALSVQSPMAMTGSATAFTFAFGAQEGPVPGQSYPVMSAPNMGTLSADAFTAAPANGLNPSFQIEGNQLSVAFHG